MKIKTMRIIDRWFGIGLCLFLSLLRRIPVGAKGKHADDIRKILFVKLAEQGSTVLAYPAIMKAVERVGRNNVYFLVFEQNRFILDALDAIPHENVIAINTDSLLSVFLSSLAAVRRMRRLHSNSPCWPFRCF